MYRVVRMHPACPPPRQVPCPQAHPPSQVSCSQAHPLCRRHLAVQVTSQAAAREVWGTPGVWGVKCVNYVCVCEIRRRLVALTVISSSSSTCTSSPPSPLPPPSFIPPPSFSAALGEEGARMVDINTVDGFQGREKDIILFSCVR